MGRYLGQHFLINRTKLRKIVEALNLKSGDTVIEIGPGHGELTKGIIKKLKDLKIKKFKIIAIEKDKKLIEVLKNRVALPYREALPEPNKEMIRDKEMKDKEMRDKEIKIEVVEGDALKALSRLVQNSEYIPRGFASNRSKIQNYKIVGNIPYYITGRLLRIIGEMVMLPYREAPKFKLVVLTIQKEVAERICAEPPKMNFLAASVQFWAEQEIIGYISKKDFRPMPKVDSAIITLKTRIDADWTRTDAEKYYRFIKILFKQPRKIILNNLISNFQFPISKVDLQKLLTKLGINPQDRPQNLSIEQIKKLSTLF